MKELLKLGCDEKRAVTAALSRNRLPPAAPAGQRSALAVFASLRLWRLSRTYATQLGMSNEWLSWQGLVSIGDLWSAVHYPQSETKPRREPEQVNLWGW